MAIDARGHGMLLNELYAGRIVWNKVRMVKDPTTGKRISRINAKEQHRITEAPQLRVIDDATWNAAQAIKLKRSHLGAPQSRAPTASALSGLLRCGSCGGGMVSIGNHKRTARLQCGTHKESGSCTNSRKVNRDAIEAAVFAGLKDELANPIAITEYVKAYNDERRRLAREAGDQMSKLTRRNAEVARELERADRRGNARRRPRHPGAEDQGAGNRARRYRRQAADAPTPPISSHCIPARSSNTAPMSKDWPPSPPSTAISRNRRN